MSRNLIKFDCNYPKLCNQAKAQLVRIECLSECEFMFRGFDFFLGYDLKRPDGGHKKIVSGKYFLLLFVGDKGILFSTLRKCNPLNEKKYLNKVGQWFDVEVIDAG